MSDGDIGFNIRAMNDQWRLDQDEQTENVKVASKQDVVKDKLERSVETQAAPVQTDYTQNASQPKLVEPPPQMNESQQGNLEKPKPETPANQEQQLGRAQLFIQPKQESPGEPRLSAEQLTKGSPLLDPKGVKEFAQENGVTPGGVYIASAFNKANPGKPLPGPFANLGQIPQQSIYENDTKEVKNAKFQELLDNSNGDLQQLANKLGVTPQKAKEMVSDAYKKGGSDNPDVNAFAENLGEQASQGAEGDIENQTFSRFVYSSEGDVKQLSEKLGVSPDQAEQMIFQARNNPDAPVPDEVKNFVQQGNEFVSQQRNEPKISANDAFEKLVNQPEGKTADKIENLANKLGITPEQAKELLQKAVKDPSSVPPSVARLAEQLMNKAEKLAFSGALENAASNILDANLAAGDGAVKDLAKQLGISPEAAKALLMQGSVNPDGVPPFVAKLAKQMKMNALLQAFSRMQNMPSDAGVDKALSKHVDSFYQQVGNKLFGKGSQGADQLMFAKQHPELKGQLSPEIEDLNGKMEADAKDQMSEKMGIPKEYSPQPLRSANDDVGAQTYDNMFEDALAQLRENGDISKSDQVQLRQLHYHPDDTFPTPKAIQEKFQQIEGQIMPQVREYLGAPASYTPKPGLDRFNAALGGEATLNADKALDDLLGGGEITQDQAEQARELLSGATDASSEEINALVSALLGKSIQSVASKYGVDPSSIDTDMSMNNKIPSDFKQLLTNAIKTGDEVNGHFENAIKQNPEGSPLQPLYRDFLKITREALQTVKDMMFMQSSGDANRAKKDAVVELTKQMNRLDQMKRAYQERDEALEKAGAMSILMIFFAFIMAAILALLAAIILPGLIGVIIAVVVMVMAIIQAVLSATDSPAAKVFDKIMMVMEIILSVILMLPALMASIMTAVQTTLEVVMDVVMAVIKAIVDMSLQQVKNIVNQVVKLVVTLVKSMVNCLGDMLKEVGKAVGSALESLMEMGKEALTMMKSLMSAMKNIGSVVQQVVPQAISGIKDMAQGMLQNMQEAFTSFMDTLKSIGESIKQVFTQGPLKTMQNLGTKVNEGVESIMQAGKDMVEGLKGMVKNADGSIKWGTEEYTAMAKGDISQGSVAQMSTKTDKATVILGGAGAVTEGGQTITQTQIDLAKADSEAIMIRLEADLKLTDEMIAFIRKFINKIMDSLQGSMDVVTDISKSQGKFWNSMSKMSTGLAQALQG